VPVSVTGDLLVEAFDFLADDLADLFGANLHGCLLSFFLC
jgi:hypothetical protein